MLRLSGDQRVNGDSACDFDAIEGRKFCSSHKQSMSRFGVMSPVSAPAVFKISISVSFLKKRGMGACGG